MTKGRKRNQRSTSGASTSSTRVRVVQPMESRSLAQRLKPARLQSDGSGDGSATISGSEYIAAIDTSSFESPVSAGDILFAMYLGFDPDSETVVTIPGGTTTDLTTLASRVGYLSRAWEKFTFEELSFEYVPFCSALTSGGVILSTDTDPFDLGASSSTATVNSIPLQQLMVRDGAVDTQVFQHAIHRVPLDRKVHYFVQGGDGLSSVVQPGQVRLTSAGVFEVCATGTLGYAMFGSIIMHYKIRLMNPTIPDVPSSGLPNGSETELVVAPIVGGVAQLIAASASNGSYLFTPSGSSPNGFIIKQFDSTDTFVPVPWWNYTTNVFGETGVYEIAYNWATSNQNVGGGSNVDKTQVNSSSSYSDTPVGSAPTYTPAAPTYWGQYGGSASTIASGTGFGCTVGDVRRIITAAAGDALSAYINGTRTVNSASAMNLYKDVLSLAVRKIGAPSSSLYRALSAQRPRGDYFADWDQHYGTVMLGDGTLGCNVTRVIVSGDSRFDSVEGYQQSLNDAVLSDLALLPAVATAVQLYDDFLRFIERESVGNSSSGVSATPHLTCVVPASAKPDRPLGVEVRRS